MKKAQTFIAYHTTLEQVDALKAVVKALNVKFEIRNDSLKAIEKETNLKNTKDGFKEVELILKGKVYGTSLNDFLTEL